MATGSEFIGSSGTLVSTSLETVGYYYQSYALDVFTQPLATTYGGFLYVVAAITALVSFVVSGNYKLSRWFILGPALFFSSILPRTETPGPDWKFGGEMRNRALVESKALSVVRGDFAGPPVPGETPPSIPNVSSLFSWYNKLISEVVDEVIKGINKTREETDLKFVTVPQLYGYMGSQTVEDPAFRELLHLAMLGDCKRLLDAGREMADEANSPYERCERAKDYKRLAEGIRLELSPTAVSYLASLKADVPDVFDMQLTTPYREELEKFQCHMQEEFRHTCELGLGAVSCPDRTLSPAEANAPVDQFMSIARPSEAVSEDRALRMQQAALEIGSGVYSCQDIWNWVYGGLTLKAYQVVEQATEEGTKHGITEASIRKEFAELYGEDTTSPRVYRAIAKRIFRNEINRGSVSSIAADYVNRASSLDELVLPHEERGLIHTEAARTGLREWQERGALAYHAFSLPYYQGVILYVLALTFPFFALLLLVPGKHTGFLLWFALWFWAKSWDIGYATVMLLDDILHSVFVANINATSEPGAQRLAEDLSVAINSMREMDPTFNLSTYYNIISVSLSSIPVITSYLLLGSLRGGFGLIAAGQGRMAQGDFEFGQASGLGGSLRAAQNQGKIDGYRIRAQQATEARARRALAGKKAGSLPGSSEPASGQNHYTELQAALNSSKSTGSVDGEAESIKNAHAIGQFAQAFGNSGAAFGGHPGSAHGKSLKARRSQVLQRIQNMSNVGGAAASAFARGKEGVWRFSMKEARDWAIRQSIDAEGQRYAFHARLAEMFEIPWVARGGYEARFAKALAEWEMLASMSGAVGNAIGNMQNLNGMSAVTSGLLARSIAAGGRVAPALAGLSVIAGAWNEGKGGPLNEDEQMLAFPLWYVIDEFNNLELFPHPATEDIFRQWAVTGGTLDPSKINHIITHEYYAFLEDHIGALRAEGRLDEADKLQRKFDEIQGRVKELQGQKGYKEAIERLNSQVETSQLKWEDGGLSWLKGRAHDGSEFAKDVMKGANQAFDEWYDEEARNIPELEQAFQPADNFASSMTSLELVELKNPALLRLRNLAFGKGVRLRTSEEMFAAVREAIQIEKEARGSSADMSDLDALYDQFDKEMNTKEMRRTRRIMDAAYRTGAEVVWEQMRSVPGAVSEIAGGVRDQVSWLVNYGVSGIPYKDMKKHHKDMLEPLRKIVKRMRADFPDEVSLLEAEEMIENGGVQTPQQRDFALYQLLQSDFIMGSALGAAKTPVSQEYVDEIFNQYVDERNLVGHADTMTLQDPMPSPSGEFKRWVTSEVMDYDSWYALQIGEYIPEAPGIAFRGMKNWANRKYGEFGAFVGGVTSEDKRRVFPLQRVIADVSSDENIGVAKINFQIRFGTLKTEADVRNAFEEVVQKAKDAGWNRSQIEKLREGFERGISGTDEVQAMLKEIKEEGSVHASIEALKTELRAMKNASMNHELSALIGAALASNNPAEVQHAIREIDRVNGIRARAFREGTNPSFSVTPFGGDSSKSAKKAAERRKKEAKKKREERKASRESAKKEVRIASVAREESPYIPGGANGEDSLGQKASDMDISRVRTALLANPDHPEAASIRARLGSLTEAEASAAIAALATRIAKAEPTSRGDTPRSTAQKTNDKNKKPGKGKKTKKGSSEETAGEETVVASSLARDLERKRKLRKKKLAKEAKEAAAEERFQRKLAHLEENEKYKERIYGEMNGKEAEEEATRNAPMGSWAVASNSSPGKKNQTNGEEKKMEKETNRNMKRGKLARKSASLEELKCVRATLKDVNSLVPLFDGFRESVGEETDMKASKKFLEELLKSEDRAVIYMAIDERSGSSEPLGMLLMLPTYDSYSMKQLFILEALYVEPEQRGKGYAKALHGAALGYAKRSDGARVIARTDTDNIESEQLLENLGYALDEGSHYFVLEA